MEHEWPGRAVVQGSVEAKFGEDLSEDLLERGQHESVKWLYKVQSVGSERDSENMTQGHFFNYLWFFVTV